MQEIAFNTQISFPLSSSNAGCNLGLLVSLAPPTGHLLLQFPAAHCCSVPPLSLFCMCISVTTSGPGLHFFKRVSFWYDFSPQFLTSGGSQVFLVLPLGVCHSFSCAILLIEYQENRYFSITSVTQSGWTHWHANSCGGRVQDKE